MRFTWGEYVKIWRCQGLGLTCGLCRTICARARRRMRFKSSIRLYRYARARRDEGQTVVL